MNSKTKKIDEELLNAVCMDKIAEGDVEHTTLLDMALRRISFKEGAKKLNIGYNAIRGRIYRIKHRSDKSKPYSKKPGPKSRYKILEHKDLIREYRKKGLTSEEISSVLKETINADISSITIGRFLSEEGSNRMYNRTSRQKEDAQMAIKEIIIGYKTKNRKDINQQIRHKFESVYAGLGIFMALIEELNILKIIRDSYPSNTKVIESYVLTILALKLIQKKRRSDIKDLSEEEMIALFSGRDKILSCTALHRFDYDMRKDMLEKMKMIYIQVLRKYLDMSVLHIDFHVIPHFGKSEVLEINHVSSRGKNMKGALVFLVQDRESKIFSYSHANIKRSEASDETIKFLEKIEKIKIKPEWLVIDSKVTKYKNMAKIKKRGVDVVTIRRRGEKMIEEVENAKKDPNVWTKVRIKRTKGGWEKINVLTKTITAGYHDDNKKWKKIKMRQLAVINSHEKPMFIITTDFKHSIKDIVEMYPPRWLIELGIKTQTKFFDLNQLASDLDVKMDFDTFLTQIAHMLYQILAKNLYCHENSEPEKIHQNFIEGLGKIRTYDDKVVVQLKKKRSTGYLINAPILEGWVDGGKNISWLGKKLEIIWE